ncbi:uncharacterized protein SAPINGB_P000115 [Magnusiomyces paraingens]|uniref:Cyclin-like domain-containing protein n=1 Tax=Magnusiomyces paraingens TaxID=2606893 RepID=A0A5E8B4A6_9ASCO|nr:uncharacterized protein SAPINGB_P000115 [Saprochaete ingens]VVT43720.1 unnamed protein product [Saprochaete ingens]
MSQPPTAPKVSTETPSPASVEAPKPASQSQHQTAAPSLLKISQALLTPSQIQKLLDHSGIAPATFQESKIHVFELIMRASINFKFPARTICTTMMIFQQYYLLNNTNTYSLLDIVSACLLVASKIEDTPKRSKELFMFLTHLKGISLTPEQQKDKKTLIINIEREIFETIGFDFRRTSVQYYLIKISKDVDKVHKEVARVAWIISVDALLSNVYLMIPSHTIAFACIILACKILNDTSTFPIDSVVYCSTRYKVNFAIRELCELYLGLDCKLLELPYHPEYSYFVKRISTAKNTVMKEMATYRNRKTHAVFESNRSVQLRSNKFSHIGAVRYVLEWERDEVSGELLSHMERESKVGV